MSPWNSMKQNNTTKSYNKDLFSLLTSFKAIWRANKAKPLKKQTKNLIEMKLKVNKKNKINMFFFSLSLILKQKLF